LYDFEQGPLPKEHAIQYAYRNQQSSNSLHEPAFGDEFYARDESGKLRELD